MHRLRLVADDAGRLGSVGRECPTPFSKSIGKADEGGQRGAQVVRKRREHGASQAFVGDQNSALCAASA